MYNGQYEVIKPIHIFSCKDGHLKISVGTRITVEGDSAIAANRTRFPERLLDSVKDCLKTIY